MIDVYKPGLSKSAILILVLLLLAGDFSVYSETDPDARFDTALTMYREQAYEKAARQLIEILNEEVSSGEFKARVNLLLGACFEKSGQKEKAKETFLRLKDMLDRGTIDRLPAVTGVDPALLETYREIFPEKAFFDFNRPVEVSEVIKKNVVHAPRKSLEEKKRIKRKKKFPWLIAVGAVVILGTAAVFLFKQKKGVEREFREVEWVHIPAGEFLMGDNFNEGDADELPVHPVSLDGYYISDQEIGIDQYNYFCAETGRRELEVKGGASGFYFPAYGVPWGDAKAFCDWISEREGRNIHLPTEAQWEKAARGDDQRRYPWGNSEPDCDKAKLRGCPAFTYPFHFTTRHPEGRSPYGIYAMAGNVKEWCSDWYSASYYSISPKKNPTGPAGGSVRVLRGGGYDSDALGIRSANREYADPVLISDQIGFRIVMEEN